MHLRSKIYVADADRIKGRRVDEKGARGVRIQLLVDRHQAATFLMRRFTIGSHGETPLHAHNWEHEVFVLKGRGMVTDGKAKHALRAGSVVYVPPNQIHQFKNARADRLMFLCLIPKR
jgi:quercetin dioxygenase-like cupin family protein